MTELVKSKEGWAAIARHARPQQNEALLLQDQLLILRDFKQQRWRKFQVQELGSIGVSSNPPRPSLTPGLEY